jgi:hypothetical protein
MPGRWADDDQLLEALGDALRAGDVPRALVEAGKRAYRAYDIDAQLAALTHDSAADREHALAGTRGDPDSARLRFVGFRSDDHKVVVELEVVDDVIVGQLAPVVAGAVDLYVAGESGVAATVEIDEVGAFTLRPIPDGRFRLRLRTDAGAVILTDWTSL